MKARIKYIDQIKGLAILMVVIGHLIQYNIVDGTEHVVFNFIYSFHMPLFMFVSGYVAHLTIKASIFDSYGRFILNKARGLLLPFFSWALIVDGYFLRKGLEFNMMDRLQELLHDPRTGLWFLWYLFYLYLFYTAFLYLTTRFNRNNELWKDVAVLFLIVCVALILKLFNVAVYMDAFIQYLGYFFIGVFISKFLILKRLLLNVYFFSFIFFSFLLTVGYYSLNNPDFHSLGLSLFLKVFIAISGVCSIYYVVRNIEFHPLVDRLINHWGQRSLVIYATHFSLISILAPLPPLPLLSPFLLLLSCLIFALLVIETCLVIYKIIKVCPPLDILLYGARIFNK